MQECSPVPEGGFVPFNRGEGSPTSRALFYKVGTVQGVAFSYGILDFCPPCLQLQQQPVLGPMAVSLFVGWGTLAESFTDLFVAGLDLCCCEGFSLAVESGAHCLAVLCRLIAVAPLVQRSL